METIKENNRKIHQANGRRASELDEPVTKDLLIISKENIFPQDEYADTDYLSVHMDGYLKARYWLEQLMNSAENRPYAIICDAAMLEASNYSLLQLMKSNPVMQRVPFIVINREGETSCEDCMKKGIDDLYDPPLNWDDLLDRIEFLHLFKKEHHSEEDELQIEYPGSNYWSKRLFDVIVASLALLALSPMLLLIAILIKLESKGPVFYISKRAGTGYKIFDFYKFRSMRVDADKQLEELKRHNQYAEDTDEATFFKMKDDPRVTKIGRILRNTSLDEIPQLFNVIKGDMSIVGNRPLPLYEAEKLTRDEWAGRFLAPAGLTGLWQISKRGNEDMSADERVNLDLEYARNSSLFYDLKIIFQTIPAMIQKESV